MRYSLCCVLAVGVVTLGSCGRAPPSTTAEDLRVDRAMARVKVEQDRTDRAEAQKQSIAAAELRQERWSEMAPVIEVRGQRIQQENLGQLAPSAIRIQPSSGNIIADSSRTRNR